MKMNDSKPKPFVNVATACEKVMVEKDDVFSVIRIVDTFFIPDDATALLPNMAIPVSGLIMLRGDFTAEGELSLVIESPDGVRNEMPDKFPLLFSPTNQANNIICTFGMAIRHMGLSWVHVLWNGDMITKFPIKLERATTPSGAKK